MINVDKDKFMEQGYLILRQVVPPDMLEPLRQSVELAVSRQWPQGIPDVFQPWIRNFNEVVDTQTADIAEMVFHENTYGVSRQLMSEAKEIGPAGLFIFCNPPTDHGPWWWHRDISPEGKGPLEGLIQDCQANGPVYVHWNLALYDDDVLWVMPGSHKRVNTDQENRQLSAVGHGYGSGQRPQTEKRHTPLPGSVCADLKAGDAVVNHLELLHWGSNYGPKMRRTYHIGYRSFAGSSFYFEGYGRDWPLAKYLSPKSRSILDRTVHLYDEECDAIEDVFRAIIDKDEPVFRKGLVKLHPGEVGRFMGLIHLCKYAQQAYEGKNAEFGDRFTPDEIETLWHRFTPLDEALQADELQDIPGFQIPAPSKYRLNELPEDYGLDKFIADWAK